MDNDASSGTEAMSGSDDGELRAWLLHRLTDANACAAFEQRMLEDDDFGLRVRALENDLIDDYARGQLEPDDRRDVARWLLATPADRARLRAAVALAAVLGSPRASRSHFRHLRWPIARATPAHAPTAPRQSRRGLTLAVGIAAALVLTVFAYLSDQSRVVVDDGANVTTITLLASMPRGQADGVSAVVIVPKATKTVRLQVEVAGENPAMRYAVEISKATRTVVAARGLVARTIGPYRFVEIAAAAASIEGNAQLAVSGEGSSTPPQTWDLHTRRE